MEHRWVRCRYEPTVVVVPRLAGGGWTLLLSMVPVAVAGPWLSVVNLDIPRLHGEVST